MNKLLNTVKELGWNESNIQTLQELNPGAVKFLTALKKEDLKKINTYQFIPKYKRIYHTCRGSLYSKIQRRLQ